MQVPEGVTDYCTTYADCATRFPDLMAKWDAFYQVHTPPITPHKHTQLSFYQVHTARNTAQTHMTQLLFFGD